MLRQTLSKDRILSDKERKNLLILEVLRKYGPIARADIAKHTGFNVVTVSNYINNFIKKGIVMEGEFDESSGGRKPVLVEINPTSAYIIGIGLNIDSMIAIIVDLGTNIVYEIKKTTTNKDLNSLLNEMLALTEEIIDKSKVEKEKILGIGIGVPGIVNQAKNNIRWPGAFGEKDKAIYMPIKETFEQYFSIPTFTENDANAAVLGEKWLGFKNEFKNILYLFSGVGLGIMVNGNIYKGANYSAGEFGINSLSQEDLCGLSKWDIDLGLCSLAKQKIDEGADSILKDKQNIGFKDIVDAVCKGDKVICSLVEEVGEVFGRKIAFLINLLNPEMVIVGGGVEVLGDTLLNPIKKSVQNYAIEEALSCVNITPSSFGDSAIALGMIGIVTREFFINI